MYNALNTNFGFFVKHRPANWLIIFKLHDRINGQVLFLFYETKALKQMN